MYFSPNSTLWDDPHLHRLRDDEGPGVSLVLGHHQAEEAEQEDDGGEQQAGHGLGLVSGGERLIIFSDLDHPFILRRAQK